MDVTSWLVFPTDGTFTGPGNIVKTSLVADMVVEYL